MSGFLHSILQRAARHDSQVRPRTIGLFESQPVIQETAEDGGFDVQESSAANALPVSERKEGDTIVPAPAIPDQPAPHHDRGIVPADTPAVAPAPVAAQTVAPQRLSAPTPIIQRRIASTFETEVSQPPPRPEPDIAGREQGSAPPTTTLLIPPVHVPAPAPESSPGPRPQHPTPSWTVDEVVVTGSGRSNRDPAVAPEPVINVTIGRIEVRATSTSSPTLPTPAEGRRLSLDDYLKRRDGGSA